MAATTRIEVTNEFADSTRAKIVINNIDPSTMTAERIEAIRTQIYNFNIAHGGTLATKMKSANGLNWIGISKVNIVTTNKTVIF